MRRFDRLLADHAAKQTGASLMALGQWLVQNATLHVPLSHVPSAGQGLPIICVTTTLGSAIPVFSNPEKLGTWKPGAQYADIPGRILIEMADKMPQIEGIYLDLGQTPNAWIPRNSFETLLKL